MTDPGSDPAVPAVSLTRELPAPPAVVWRAFTDSGALAGWYWPERLAPRVATDPQVGGRYRISSSLARSAVGTITGEYLTVTEPERLVFTWAWEGDDATSRVTVLLGPSGADGTALTLEHDQLTDEEDRQAHTRGWRDALDRLPAWLDTQKAARQPAEQGH